MSTGQQLTVFRVGPQDAERLRALRLRALADAPEAFMATAEEEAELPPEHWRTLAGDDTVAVFIAGPDEPGLAMAGGRWFDRPRGIAQLWGMWVDPAARRHGVGEQLVAAVAAWARGAGATYLRLGVVDGLSAIHFYEHLDFTPTGERRRLTREPSAEVLFLMRRL